MIMTLFWINMMMSLIFISLTHPLSMGLVLLIQTLVISLITGNYNYNFWFSYILFLIMVGGMLILFIYMTSIASNEKFSFNMKFMSILMIIPLAMTLSTIKFDLNLINNEMIKFNNQFIINTSMSKFINYPSNLMLIFMIVYLLITLIATVKISNFKHGPLRQMN